MKTRELNHKSIGHLISQCEIYIFFYLTWSLTGTKLTQSRLDLKHRSREKISEITGILHCFYNNL